MANANTVTMKFTAIHTARITRAIAEKCKDLGKELPDYGDESLRAVSLQVKDYLTQEDFLMDELEDAYNEVTGKFGCPFSPEEALILPTHGFNPEPMDAWVSGDVAFERAIEMCFEQTFYDAMVDEYGEPPAKKKPEPKLVKASSKVN